MPSPGSRDRFDLTDDERRLRDVNEALIAMSVRQHELIEEAELARRRLLAEINERQRAEERLREREEQYRLLFDLTPAAVFGCDQDGIIQAYNRRSAELWGREPVCGVETYWDALGLRRTDARPLPHEQGPMLDVLRSGEPLRNVELTIERPNGSRALVLMNVAPTRDARGIIDGSIVSLIDITERQRAEAAVDRARKYAEATLRTSPVPLLVLESDLRVVTANDAFYTHFRVTPDRTEHRRVYELGNGQWNIPELRQLLEDVLPNHSTFNDFEVAHDFEDIGRRVMLLNGRRMEVEDGGPERIVLVIQDFTARRAAEDARRESEERQAFLLKLSDEFRAAVSADSIGIMCVEWLARHMKADRCFINEMLMEKKFARVHPEYRAPGLIPVSGEHRYADFPEVMRRVEAGEPLQISNVTADAALSDLDKASLSAMGIGAVIVAPLRRGDGNAMWALTISTVGPREWTRDDFQWAQEVAERTWSAMQHARAEAALRQSEERLRTINEGLEERVRERTAEITALFARLVRTQEDERRRIARDMHDQLGQQMTALRMNLELLASRTAHDDMIAAQAARTQQLAEDLDRSIDFLTWDLRPAALDHLGLAPALEHLVTGWSERFRIPAAFDASSLDSLRLPPEVEANLYRLTQEALHNIVKHAQATQVAVSLQRRTQELFLVIEDNGCGFNTGVRRERATGGLGLVSMQERGALIGGTVDIESAPDQGTTIFVRVPIVPGQAKL